MSEKINYKTLFERVNALRHRSISERPILNLFTQYSRENVPVENILKAIRYSSMYPNYRGTYDVETLLRELSDENNFIPEGMKAGEHWLIHTTIEQWGSREKAAKLNRFIMSASANDISLTIVGNYFTEFEDGKITNQIMPSKIVFTSTLMVMFESDKAVLARHIALPSNVEIEF